MFASTYNVMSWRLQPLGRTLPPAGVAASTFAAFYLAAAPVGHFVAGQVAEWLKPKIVYVPLPVAAKPTPPPIANTTPTPHPTTHAGNLDGRAPIEEPKPPAPSPTIHSGGAGSPIVVPLLPGPPLVESVRPRPALERPRRPRVGEFPREGGRELLPRALAPHEPGGLPGFPGLNREGLPPRLGPHFGGGFPFMPRPMPGGVFHPRLPIGGARFGLFHF